MKHFCFYLIGQCAPFRKQELFDAQDRIKVLEQELAQANQLREGLSLLLGSFEQLSADNVLSLGFRA